MIADYNCKGQLQTPSQMDFACSDVHNGNKDSGSKH
jgi:hypothetical protein